MRTEHDDMPAHLRAPYENVTASHHEPEGILWELDDGRYVDPSYLLTFVREHGRIPQGQEWEEMVEDCAAETMDEARYNGEG